MDVTSEIFRSVWRFHMYNLSIRIILGASIIYTRAGNGDRRKLGTITLEFLRTWDYFFQEPLYLQAPYLSYEAALTYIMTLANLVLY